MIFVDTETCGFHGPAVTIQYGSEDETPIVHDVWTRPVKETLILIEFIATHDVCAFNLVFDWFHLFKLWTVFQLVENKSIPPIIDEVADLERYGMTSDDCLKPKRCLDLWVHALRGPLQTLMERDDIRIRKVPIQIVDLVAEELASRIEIEGIYFAKAGGVAEWKREDLENGDWADLVLRFRPGHGLKILGKHLLGRDVIELPIPKEWHPKEDGWAPFYRPDASGDRWPHLIQRHIEFWRDNATARRYAEQDVELLRDLWIHFGRPEPGDDDSELTACVACSRWRGYTVDLAAANRLRERIERDIAGVVTSPAAVLAGLKERLSPEEAAVLTSTRAHVLETIAKGEGDAAEYAARVDRARTAQKRIELLTKLVTAGRMHPDFKVVGTLSNRMSGAGGLNAQGIPHEQEFREIFHLADGGLQLSGGDFSGYEVTIAAAAWGDPQLTEDLKTGAKFHALFGADMYGVDYDEIKSDASLYNLAKQGGFASFYGAEAPKIAETMGLSLEEAEAGLERFSDRYPQAAAARQRIFEDFCALTQPNGIGTAVVWKDPADKVSSLLGDDRYFTLENRIVRELYDLACDPPRSWRLPKVRVQRRQRDQTTDGAARSALYAACFGIQGRCMRAAANHVIQSTGARITKRTHRRIWDLQPPGVYPWVVQPMNVHDEVLVPNAFPDIVARRVIETVESFRDVVPLIKMEWRREAKNWASVK